MPGALPPVFMTTSFQLFRKVEELADDIRPEDYVLPPNDGAPEDSVIMGEATDSMKRLFTLVTRLHVEMAKDPEATELLVEATNLAMIYEVWQHFGFRSPRFGFNSAWQVFRDIGS